MSPENKIEMPKLAARKQGKCACKYCNTMKFKYNSEKMVIDHYCKGNNLIYRFDGDTLLVQSEIGAWKILYNRNWEQFLLYHANRIPNDMDLKLLPSNGYHAQKDAKPSKSIMRFMIYIREHDNFRKGQLENIEDDYRNKKCSEKNYKKLKKKAKTYRVARVLQLMSVIEQDEEMRLASIG